MSEIGTLVEDIYELFRGKPKEISEEAIRAFSTGLANAVAGQLLRDDRDREPTLRMSNLGKPDRKLWYELKSDLAKEEFAPHTRIKFLYGHILEELLLFLSGVAGHDVSRRQVEVEVDGIIGHNDAVIDGVVVDVKSASTYSFKKFKSGSIREDDPFGYMEQLAGYSKGLGDLDGAFLAIDKTLGHITLHEVSRADLATIDIESRIKHIKEVVESDQVPERCYEPEPDGASGNLALGVGCNYCSYKFDCWRDVNRGIGLRTFLYANGPKHFVHIEKEPRVLEVTF